MRALLSFVVFIAAAASLFAQAPKPLAERLAAQNALFDEQYESDLRNFPERATSFGDYRYNDRLADYSLDAIAKRHETDESFLKRLEDISTADFSDRDQLSHDLLIRVLEQRIADFGLKEFEMPINTQSGIHTNLADLPLSVPFDSVKHYEDYVSRLHQIPRVLAQVTEVLRAGMKEVEPESGVHICLRAKSAGAVDAFHAAALDAGGSSDGAPGLRPHDRVRYYAAFVRDPDGNRVEAVTFPADDANPTA